MICATRHIKLLENLNVERKIMAFILNKQTNTIKTFKINNKNKNDHETATESIKKLSIKIKQNKL